MNKVNRGPRAPSGPSTNGSTPPPAKQGTLSPEVKELFAIDSHPDSSSLALRERNAHILISRAVSGGVRLDSAPRSRMVNQVTASQLRDAIDVVSRAASKRGAAREAFANPAEMAVSRSIGSANKTASLVNLGNILSILEANFPPSHQSVEILDAAKNAIKYAVVSEVFSITQVAAKKIPQAADSSIRNDVNASLPAIENKRSELTESIFEKNSEEMVSLLCSRLEEMTHAIVENHVIECLRKCSSCFLQLIDDKNFDGNFKHTLAGLAPVRTSIALLGHASAQANWGPWRANISEDYIMPLGETARVAMLKLAVKGPRNGLAVDVPGWYVGEYEFGKSGRAFVATKSRDWLDVPLGNPVGSIILYFKLSHENVSRGNVTKFYENMISKQYDPVTNSFGEDKS